MVNYYKDLEEIFLAGVKSVDPYLLIKRHMRVENEILTIEIPGNRYSVNLAIFKNVFVFGAGKAAAPMARAIEEVLGNRIDDGIIAVKKGYTTDLEKIKIIEAGHPVPDLESIRAAEMIIELSGQANKETLILGLISGGGSSLLAHPFEIKNSHLSLKLTLEELKETTSLLLASGANINEMNCIRKHLSSIKGGRLARLMHPATQINMILSDVPGDRLDTIASGLTTWDETTYEDAIAILKKYSIDKKVPEATQRILEAGKRGLIPETPKKNDPAFLKVKNLIIGTNYTALLGAAEKARELGYNTTTLSSWITGEARVVSKVLAGIAKDASRYELLVKKPSCIIGGGETTVTLSGDGKGGRNQELALSFLLELETFNETSREDSGEKGIYMLSASTDGSDGPTDAAGAMVSGKILKKSRELRLDPEAYLRRNDSYTFFERAGGLFKTGPTNTNVCDIQIIIVV